MRDCSDNFAARREITARWEIQHDNRTITTHCQLACDYLNPFNPLIHGEPSLVNPPAEPMHPSGRLERAWRNDPRLVHQA
ncbi:hypothetical protein [Alkalinema sp. FACHB-956]|uniref:hypothetical protein n=1 Tax=Alkalinema sp. FACHB-956 TaxID=2692768 RepID=UPI001687F24E|nr:hypothetical protein [Alkalinema sp. FACHB-956]MBD2329016.1 hypothetical protein [Alkalinema sp. FACHB-956]